MKCYKNIEGTEPAKDGDRVARVDSEIPPDLAPLLSKKARESIMPLTFTQPDPSKRPVYREGDTRPTSTTQTETEQSEECKITVEGDNGEQQVIRTEP